MTNKITVFLDLEKTKFGRGIKSVQSDVKETEGFLNKFKVGASGLLSAFTSSPAAIGGATAAIGAFGVASVNAASDLDESINAVNVTFGESADKILEFGDNAAKSVGLAKSEFNELATPLGSILKNAGFAIDDVADKTIVLTQRAADMASVFNTDVSDALGAIQAGLRGEQDPLEKYGVGLSAAKVEARALADTGKDTAKALTDQEKQLARVEIILDQTNQTAGDFANTSDGLANQTRILGAEFENLKAKAGTKLIPILSDLATLLIEIGDDAGYAKDKIEQIPGGKSLLDALSTNLFELPRKSKSEWDELGRKIGVIPEKAQEIGTLRQQFEQIVAAGNAAKDATTGVGDAVAATGEEISHTADIWFDYLNAQGEATGSFAEMSSASDKAAHDIEDVGTAAEESASALEILGNAAQGVADAVDTAFDKVRGNLDLEDLIDDITDQFGKIAEAQKEATDPEGIRNYNRTVRDLQRQLLTLLDSIKGIPPDKRIQIAAQIQAGDVDQLYRILGDLEKGVTIPVSFATPKTPSFTSLNGLFGPGIAPSGPIFNNPTTFSQPKTSGYIDNSTTIINNPVGSTPTTQYIDGQTDFRRNGLR